MLAKPLGTAIYIDNLQLSFQENPGILKKIRIQKNLGIKIVPRGEPPFELMGFLWTQLFI